MSGAQSKGERRVAIELGRGTSVEEALTSRSAELSSEEERVVRGLHGLPAPRGLRLERKASGEALDELLLMEMELRKRYQAHLARVRPQPSAEKDRMVRALRAKR